MYDFTDGVKLALKPPGTRRSRRAAEPERPETLAGLLRPVAVAAFHMGATAEEPRTALERAMVGIFANAE